jgi:hypothetical protein
LSTKGVACTALLVEQQVRHLSCTVAQTSFAACLMTVMHVMKDRSLLLLLLLPASLLVAAAYVCCSLGSDRDSSCM